MLKESLRGKLFALEKSAGYPEPPNISPPILYIQNVLNQANLPPPGKGSPRMFYLKEIEKRVKTAWPSMDPSLKAAFEKQSLKLETEHKMKVEDWYKQHEGSELAKEIDSIKARIANLNLKQQE